jgi:hypothetical protein
VRRLDENNPDLADIPQSALAVMRVIADHLCALEAHLALIDEQIEAQRRSSASAQALDTILGIGVLMSAALVAHASDTERQQEQDSRTSGTRQWQRVKNDRRPVSAARAAI